MSEPGAGPPRGAERGGTPPERLRIHYHRPPDRERVYEQDVVLEHADVVVTLARGIALDDPVRVGGRTVLDAGSDVVWFTFPGAWHDIGRFHRADDAFTGFYANVLTPCVMEGRAWRTTDLFLDVWKGAGGRVELLDEAELDEAVAAGYVDGPTAARARSEAHRLLGLARSGDWPPSVVREWTLERARAALSRPASSPDAL